ncbi:sugar phosphate isomerase/epimerase [Haloactinopolyspora alba]|uniref:Sugar phosphate isomerase/epimerase n=1 Tax=Haloactinopolyspora alba TaxID=648780 RepID=A0A2P8DV20_9ACTN|nr:sugar phosphate isomerase/epimerase [Haloactinopolyspora alba]PSL01078.1 sugar phosphate isomerase/epimerase [Haloactinopolyspora alba]
MTPGTGDMDRRTFLRSSASTALAAGALGVIGAGSASAADRPIPRPGIGMHLYTMRRSLADDFAGTLGELARIGYATVGVSGRHGHSAAEIRSMIDDTGMRAVLEHVGLNRIDDRWEQACEEVVVLGGEWIVIRSLPGVDYTADSFRALADTFNRAGETASRYGLKVLFHNHDASFATDEGRVLYDILVEETEPEYVGFELDVYWMVRGGYEPADYFVRYPARFPALHVKDMAPDGGFADVGSGVLDFEAMFADAHRGGVRQWLVEHDDPESEFATARNSFGALRAMRF